MKSGLSAHPSEITAPARKNAAIPFSVFGGSKDWMLTLGIRNLFDEKYFESARHYYECLAGEPRTFEIGLKAEF